MCCKITKHFAKHKTKHHIFYAANAEKSHLIIVVMRYALETKGTPMRLLPFAFCAVSVGIEIIDEIQEVVFILQKIYNTALTDSGDNKI